jgi:hypothetical protein
MVKLLENRKRVFWEALVLTVVVFLFGLIIGVSFESNKLNEINNYYIKSETSIMDAFALNSFSDLNSENCDILVQANLDFADNIYKEAILLEKYEKAKKITESMEIMHRKYDVLRTFLWINTIKTADKCGREYSTVVYLYESKTEDLTKKATQNVWSKVLSDLKQEYGKNIILIPLASDNDLISLNSLISQFNVTSYPAVIINEEKVIFELTTAEDLKKYIH